VLSTKESSSSKHESGTVTDKRVTIPYPSSASSKLAVPSPSSPRVDIYEAGPSTAYATPKKKTAETDNDDEGNEYIDKEVEAFGKRYIGNASPYLTAYLYYKPFLDKQYGLRKEDGSFMIGNSTYLSTTLVICILAESITRAPADYGNS
jgi:hypothetical protein